jgi:uncharacterized protein (DUF1501 family)
MKRRTFLRGMLGSGLTMVGSSVLRMPLISTANAATNPTLVVVFQRGGCDGLNAVVPFADPDYYKLRPTIGIPQPNSTDPTSALDLNGFFGLHPGLAPFKTIYDDGNLAILPTVQYPKSSHSHFSGEVFIESGDPNTPVNISDGWLNRHLGSTLVNKQLQNPLQAVHFGSTLSHALQGNIPVQSFSFIDSFNLGLNGAAEASLSNSVLPVYEDIPASASSYQQLVHQYGQLLFNNLNVISNINTANYVPANGAVYPNSSYGRRLKETAQLIKSNIGLELVTIDIGGWDTHSNQGGGESDGRQARRFQEFSGGIAALYKDLGAMMDNVIILTMTEFGRTAKENGSNGTDHGNASSWFAIGPNIKGGIYGEWPGLSDSNLARGRYLQYTVDYRNIMGDILLNHFQHSKADLAALLPQHNYSEIGLI